MAFNLLTENEALTKWSAADKEALSVADIKNPEIRRATAMVMENTENYEARHGQEGFLSESSSTAPTSVATGQWNPISLALARRVIPDLFAWKCVGVQPMNGPVGLAYAMRFRYRSNPTNPQEANFDVVPQFAGFTGSTSGTSGTADQGTGVSLSVAEAWTIGAATDLNSMPEIYFNMDSTAVTALTRKVASTISIEAMMDVKAMQNIDVKRELTERLHAEISAEVDRELLQSMKTQAITTANGGVAAYTFQTSAADGRWSAEKCGNVANSIIAIANSIRLSTREAAANFVIVSPTIASVLQAVPVIFTAHDLMVDGIGATNTAVALSEIGVLNRQIRVFVDQYATSDYALLGYKGPNSRSTGVIFSPYVMGLTSEVVDPGNFGARIGAMNRYAITNSLLGAGRYYRQINFIGISGFFQTV